MYVNGAEPDPKHFEENIVANKKFVGEIERLFINDRKTAYGDKKSISIANNKVYYGLGLHDSSVYLVDGVELQEGMTVSFEYTDGKYKNVVLETLKIVQQEKPKETKTRIEKENMGMLRCHAFNGATSLLSSEDKEINKDSILEAAKVIHSVTIEMKEWFGNTELGGTMDQRELGNTVGNAVINCANFSTRTSLSSNVKDFLMKTVSEMTDYISGKQEESQVPVEQTKPETKVEEKQSEPVVSSVGMDFDDEIPFAPIGLQYPQLLLVM